MGLKFGLFRFLPHTQKHTPIQAATIFARRAAFYASLSSRSDRGRCRCYIHLTSHGYFDHGKTRRASISAPCRNKDGAYSGICRVYLIVIIFTVVTTDIETEIPKFQYRPRKFFPGMGSNLGVFGILPRKDAGNAQCILLAR